MKIRILAIAFSLLVLTAAPSAAQWDGCGFGVGAGLWMGQADFGLGGPGTQGQKVGVSVNCDRKMGAFVAGGEVTYDWFLGDVKDLGASRELGVLGRLGVLTSATNLFYATGGWGQTEAFGKKIDGWKMGLGDEFRIPNSPMYLDLRTVYTSYDATDLGLSNGRTANSIETMARLKFKFGPGMFGSGNVFSVEEEAPAKVCDPKMANCKK